MSKSLKNTLSKVVLLAAAVALVPQVASARGGMGGSHATMSAPRVSTASYTAKKVTRAPSHNTTTKLSPVYTKFPGHIGALGNAFQPTTKLPPVYSKFPGQIGALSGAFNPVSGGPKTPPTCPMGNCGFGGFPVGFGLGYGLGTFAGYGGYGGFYSGYGSYAPATTTAAPIVADASTTTTDATVSSSPATAPAPSSDSTAAASANAVLTALLTAAH